jgi:hypothetical protein
VTDFRKIFKYKISRKSVSGSRVLRADRRTDRQTWQIYSLFSQFCEHAWKRNLLHSPVLFSSSSKNRINIIIIIISVHWWPSTVQNGQRICKKSYVAATFFTDLWFLQAAELCYVCETKRIQNHVVKFLNRKNDDVDCRYWRGCYCDAERARVTALIAFSKWSSQECGLCTVCVEGRAAIRDAWIPAIFMFLNVSVNPSSLGRRLIYLQFRFVISMCRFVYAMVRSYSYWKTTRYRLRVKWLLLNPTTVTHTWWYLSLRRVITMFAPSV